MPDLMYRRGPVARLGRARSLTDVVRALLAPGCWRCTSPRCWRRGRGAARGVAVRRLAARPRGPGDASRVDAAAEAAGRRDDSDEAFPGDAVGQPVRLTGRWLPRSTVYVADRAGRPPRRLGGHPGRGVRRLAQRLRSRCALGCARLRHGAGHPRRTRVGAEVRDAPAAADGAGPGDRLAAARRGLRGRRRRPERRRDPRDAGRRRDPARRPGPLRRLRGRPRATVASTGADRGRRRRRCRRRRRSPSLRNLLYALEWWVFAGFAVYVWWRWCRDELSGRVTGVPSSA